MLIHRYIQFLEICSFKFFTHFNGVVYDLFLNYEFCIPSDCNSFIRCMIYKCFLPLIGLTFRFLDGAIFSKKKSFNFHEGQFVYY